MVVICGGKYAVSDDFEGECRNFPQVLMAKNTETDEVVAVKRMAAGREETATELKIWQTVYPEAFRGSYTENGWVYIERKWYGGFTLDEFLQELSGDKEFHGINDRRALEIMLKIIEEVGRFHEKSGLLHGDLKPGNIIGSDGKVYLVDFETAGRERLAGNVRLGKAKTIKFITPGFSAPEITRGELTVRSDIYSLGKILLYMLTGEVTESSLGGDPAVAGIIDSRTDYKPSRRVLSLEALSGSIKQVLEDPAETRISRLLENVGTSMGNCPRNRHAGGCLRVLRYRKKLPELLHQGGRGKYSGG